MPDENATPALDMMNYGMYVIGSRGPHGVNRMAAHWLNQEPGGPPLPFNGQHYRREIVDTLVTACACSAFVETGTWRGATTEYLARFRGPVYSAEANPFHFGMAHARLFSLPNVRLTLGKSGAFLRKLNRSGQFANKTTLFYLDAHWFGQMPLPDELDAIFTEPSPAASSVIVIDDFEVPDDPDYGFDDYGSGRALTWSYLHPHLARHDLVAFVPALPGREETGARRGCLVLTRDPRLATCIGRLACVRPHPLS